MKLGALDTEKAVVIVAEISCNHGGKREVAEALVHIAKQSGADMVKFQCLTPDEMADQDDDPIPSGPWAGRTLFDLYTETQTPWEWLPDLFALARSIGLEPFASVFGPASADFISRLNPPCYKVSSFEINYAPLIGMLAGFGKPVLVSMGMASGREIQAVQGYFVPASHLVLLHCVSGYPTPAIEANLPAFSREYWDMVGQQIEPKGLSYHARSPIIPALAVGYGAEIIEAHLCVDHNFPTQDEPFSMDREEFAIMVGAVREAEAALTEHVTPSEDAQRPLRRRQVNVNGEFRWLRRVRP